MTFANSATPTGTKRPPTQQSPPPAIPTNETKDREHHQRGDQVGHDRCEQPEDQTDARGDRDDHREHPNHRVLAEVQRYSSNRSQASA